jgi:hypothetical protein
LDGIRKEVELVLHSHSPSIAILYLTNLFNTLVTVMVLALKGEKFYPRAHDQQGLISGPILKHTLLQGIKLAYILLLSLLLWMLCYCDRQSVELVINQSKQF